MSRKEEVPGQVLRQLPQERRMRVDPRRGAPAQPAAHLMEPEVLGTLLPLRLWPPPMREAVSLLLLPDMHSIAKLDGMSGLSPSYAAEHGSTPCRELQDILGSAKGPIPLHLDPVSTVLW